MKRIGFDKVIKLEWMDELAFTLGKKDPDEALSHIRKKIAQEIKGKESQRKHVTVLKRIWVKTPEKHQNLRDRALGLIKKGDKPQRLAVHWGMSLLAYPFFHDMASVVGNLSRLQEEITLKQIRQRIVESWGDRRTLEYAIPRLLKSFSEWGVLEMRGGGKYKTVPKIDLEDKETLLWLLEIYFYSIEEKIIYIDKLNKTPALFPFSYHVKAGDLFGSKKFEVSRQGLSSDVVELKLGKN